MVPERKKPFSIITRQETTGFETTVASARPYANNVQLLQTDDHANTSSLKFYRPDALPDAQATV